MTARGDLHEELRARLHEAAGAHEPDRARILARVERGMAAQDRPGHRGTPRPAAGWARVAGATAAVAGVLAAGGFGVAAAVRDDAPPQRVVVASPTPAATSASAAPPPAPEPTPSRTATADATGRAAAPPAPPAPETGAARTPEEEASTVRPPAATGVADGPLWSDGSVDPGSHDYWAQSNVTLKTSAELTALTVELRVALNGGVASTGAWRSLPEDDFAFAVAERDGFLVYTWTLKEGRTVPAGEWVFAGQYDHRGPARDAYGDRYAATGTAGSERLSVAGDFA
ncbi:hypothetical protein ABZ397_22040 [Streptomyces sp. NPDC005876]|uniref:hypothetical protein n=1 Tax=Streptomyces sp. NPDC005876 TaxID=3157076 RepID=UPI0033D03ED4